MSSATGKFQLLNSAHDFSTDSADGCLWDEQTALFRLAEQQSPRLADIEVADALDAWANAGPIVADAHGQLGFLSADQTQFQYAVGWPIDNPAPVLASNESTSAATLAELALDPVDAPPGARFVDLHLGGDGRAALPYSNGADQHGLLVVHLGRRWQRRCRLADQPRRAWVDHLDRIWVAADNWLALCEGEPLPQPYRADPRRFEPQTINPEPLRRVWRQGLPEGFELLAMSADRQRVYLLMAHTVDRHQRLFVRSLDGEENAEIHSVVVPADLPFAIDIAAIGAGRVALMLPGFAADAVDLPVLEISEQGDSATLLPRRYPQHSQARPRFVGGLVETARYLSNVGPKQLHRLQQARFAREGSATLNRILDSGEPDAQWHRIYLDACIPPGCTLRIEVKAFADIDEPGVDWQQQPAPHWQPISSELPFYQSRFEPDGKTHGLFEILLQRESGPVRDILGRYLQVRVHMQGDGRHTPAISALRVYHPRLSWQRAYLPQHFHQQETVVDEIASANGADVRERALAAFEGMMTPIEDRIIAAEHWLYPQSTPAVRLADMAAMLGTELPVDWPLHRQRNWLQFQAQLQLRRGTFAGLCLALDIATDGAVSRGQLVPVENYRLRRTLATILGVDMSDDRHPLTLGTGQSGNSIVGESLILTDDEAREFLALFAPELADTSADRATVERFFDHYGHRLSVVIHSDARALRKTVEHVLDQQLPGHTQWQLLETDHPFVLGLSPLLGIDTWLEREPAWRDIVLDDTYLGREGILHNPPALAPIHVLPSQGDQP